MKFISYDQTSKDVTVTLNDDDLLDLLSITDGLLNTFDYQDSTMLGVRENRLQEIRDELQMVLNYRG